MSTLADEAAAWVDVTLTPDQEAQFAYYAGELALWNTHTNLTAITDADGVRVRHFLDSLTVARAVPMTPGLRLIDVGTGAGFPGLPLRIAYPDIKLTLLETTGKKVAFLQSLVDTFAFDDVTLIKARAEDAGQDAAHRDAYDLVLARAVARLPSLLEYLLPFARVGGVCIAMKGRTAKTEAADSQQALATLGGRIKGIETVELPGLDEPHYLVVVEKIAPTPGDYPRQAGTPTRKPL